MPSVTHSLALRLILDLIAAGLLLVALAYHWLGNTVHELVGTALFLLLVAHGVFHRRWYGGIPKAGRAARGRLDIGFTLLLLVAMLALFVTSALISNTLYTLIALDGGFTARQIHTLAAYWAFVLVAVHLGLRWPIVMGAARRLFRIGAPSAVRTLVLRAIAVGSAIQGVRSSFALDIGTKLSMQFSLDWWRFDESVAGFFLHCAAIAGLHMALAYYLMKWAQRRSRIAPSARRFGQRAPSAAIVNGRRRAP